MRKLYLCIKEENSSRNHLDTYSITDDGVILGEHICSTRHWMMNDLVKNSDRQKTIEDYFKLPLSEIEIIQISWGETPPIKQ